MFAFVKYSAENSLPTRYKGNRQKFCLVIFFWTSAVCGKYETLPATLHFIEYNHFNQIVAVVCTWVLIYLTLTESSEKVLSEKDNLMRKIKDKLLLCISGKF